MENPVKNIQRLAESYFGVPGVLKPHHAHSILQRLKGRPPEALFAMVYRDKCNDVTGFLGNYLDCDVVWTKFEAYWESLRIAADLNETLDEDRFTTLTGAGFSPLDIIKKQGSEISPLYRYIMALSMGFYGEVEHLKPKAEQQLRENPFYFDKYKRHQALFPLRKEEVII